MTPLGNATASWGEPPWRIDFQPASRELSPEVDVAIIGGGFTGLAAAAWLRRLAPEKTTVVLEAARLGSGASGRTGGIALAESAAGDLPGLGDVLGGFVRILQMLEVDCDLTLPGVWEIGRTGGWSDSSLNWSDSGGLRVVNEVPGGTVDPGKLVSGLGRAAERLGAVLVEQAAVREIRFDEPIRLALPEGELRASKVLFATNAQALDLSGLAGRAQAKFTLALATEALPRKTLEAAGLGQRKAFYTVDLPYLWGRLLPTNGIVFGAGLLDIRDSRELASIQVHSGPAVERLRSMEQRVRRLHPALRSLKFTHRWGGPISFGNSYRPYFGFHPRSRHVVVLGAYSGQGVTLSVYLGCWSAEVLLGRRDAPSWGALVK
ncbi:MAG TPA: FAD-binding oxidoreductase [Candidatus Acidoferrales bacterium]|nr:FAD-binding oxidoreductase [Candidatus Acidoferrales bacterium]